MALPTLVIVPGFWEGPAVFEPLREVLAKANPPIVDIHTAPLQSTGKKSPGNPNMDDDIQGVREVIEPLVQAGKRIVVLGHSAGGFISAAAVKGLEVGGENAAGADGGVEKMLFVAAGLFPVGTEVPDLPFMDFQGDQMFCKDPDNVLFNDVPAAVTAKFKPLMQYQPGGDWNGVIRYAGWEKIPSAFLICEKDACVPPEMQKAMATACQCKTYTANLGHMAQLSHPEQVAETLLDFINYQT